MNIYPIIYSYGVGEILELKDGCLMDCKDGGWVEINAKDAFEKILAWCRDSRYPWPQKWYDLMFFIYNHIEELG